MNISPLIALATLTVCAPGLSAGTPPAPPAGWTDGCVGARHNVRRDQKARLLAALNPFLKAL